MKVVELPSPPNKVTVFVIEVAPDVFYGEKWFAEGKITGRVYPSWTSRERAEARLKEIKNERESMQ